MVPIRVIGKLYGKVSWYGEAKSVSLETPRDIKIKPIAPKKQVPAKNAVSQVKADYENEYFSVVVPKEWKGKWTVESYNDRKIEDFYQVYIFSYNGGGVQVSLVKPEYKSKWLKNKDLTYKGDASGYGVFIAEASAGFFDRGAKLYLK